MSKMDKLCGYEVVSQGELFVTVKGVLKCADCNKKKRELTAIKELSKAYCYKCFLENTKSFHTDPESNFINICFIRN